MFWTSVCHPATWTWNCMFLLSVYFETKLETVSFVYGFVFRNHSFMYISIQNFQENCLFLYFNVVWNWTVLCTSHQDTQSDLIWIYVISRNFFSSGGMGGSLNQFYWGILVSDPPRYHSHLIECTLALCWEPLIQPHEIFTPKLCWEKNHSLAAAVELSVYVTSRCFSTLRVMVAFQFLKDLAFAFRRGI